MEGKMNTQITPVNMNALAAEAHENAVAHGFYEDFDKGDIDRQEMEARNFALIHSELGEAVNEHRRGFPPLHWLCKSCDDGPCLVDDETAVRCDFTKNGKPPEGVAVELADFVIRLLDYAAWAGVELPDADVNVPTYGSLLRLVNALHDLVCDMAAQSELRNVAIPADSRLMASMITTTICVVQRYLAARGLDLWEIVREKMSYNKTRPYRHGKLY
jgi:hypothetical protein